MRVSRAARSPSPIRGTNRRTCTSRSARARRPRRPIRSGRRPAVTACTVVRAAVRIQRSASVSASAGGSAIASGKPFVERGDEAQRVPHLLVEAARFVALFFVEAQLLRLEPHLAQDAEAEAVGAVLLDEVHRVDRVAEALAHLAALQIEHQRRDEHGRERDAGRRSAGPASPCARPTGR